MNKADKGKKSMNLDKLAAIIAKGFESMATKTDLAKLEQKVDNNHEEIMLKLDNVAYRFEIVELQRRVQLLEKKANFKR